MAKICIPFQMPYYIVMHGKQVFIHFSLNIFSSTLSAQLYACTLDWKDTIPGLGGKKGEVTITNKKQSFKIFNEKKNYNKRFLKTMTFQH